jgi:lysozyme
MFIKEARMRPINAAGLRLIMSFESFSASPYQDEGGVWTIGYGHTPPVTEAEAEQLLRQDLKTAQESVARLVTAPLTDNQYAAVVSLVYNAGPEPLRRTLGAKLNAGDASAAQEFLRWRLAGGMVSDGLVRRREAERALFRTPDSASV